MQDLSLPHPHIDDPLDPSISGLSNEKIEGDLDLSSLPIKHPDYENQVIPSGEIQIKQVDLIVIKTKRYLPIKKIAIQFYEIINQAFEPIDLTLENSTQFLPNLEIEANIFKGLDLIFTLPHAAHSLYSLVKDWHRSSMPSRALTGGTLLHANIASASAITSLLKLTPHLSEAATLGVAKTSTILGPIGLGLGSILLAVKGTASALQAKQLTKKIKAIRDFPKGPFGPALTNILNREERRLLTTRIFIGFSSLQSFLLAAGFGLAAFAAAIIGLGTLAALVSTPVGWAALGLIATSSLIAVGVFAYKRACLKKEAIHEQEHFALLLYQSMDSHRKESLLNHLVDIQKQKREFNLAVDQNAGKIHLVKLICNHVLPKKENLSIDLHHCLVRLKRLGFTIKKDEVHQLKDSQHKEGLRFEDIENLIEKKLREEWKAQPKQTHEKALHIFTKLAKKELEEQASETLQAFISEQLAPIEKNNWLAQTCLKMITDAKGKHVTLADINRYAKEVVTSPIWPHAPNLACQVIKVLSNQSQEL